MDIVEEGMLKAYIDAFDSFPCDNEKINAEVERFKQELTQFARSANDVTAFMAGYDSQGYGKRYLDLFGKITQAQAAELTVEEIEQRQQITPVQFAAQYNTAYEAIKACKYRVKAEQAYRNLFDLAERSADKITRRYADIASEMNANLNYYKYMQAATAAPDFQQHGGTAQQTSNSTATAQQTATGRSNSPQPSLSKLASRFFKR